MKTMQQGIWSKVVLAVSLTFGALAAAGCRPLSPQQLSMVDSYLNQVNVNDVSQVLHLTKNRDDDAGDDKTAQPDLSVLAQNALMLRQAYFDLLADIRGIRRVDNSALKQDENISFETQLKRFYAALDNYYGSLGQTGMFGDQAQIGEMRAGFKKYQYVPWGSGTEALLVQLFEDGTPLVIHVDGVISMRLNYLEKNDHRMTASLACRTKNQLQISTFRHVYMNALLAFRHNCGGEEAFKCNIIRKNRTAFENRDAERIIRSCSNRSTEHQVAQ
ncbi:MAG: hypothetical protein JXR76_12615 [Deltaproteobacteria bacterium]|nr:hypothetical protein [Deltaproteobacteria bacterium]